MQQTSNLERVIWEQLVFFFLFSLWHTVFRFDAYLGICLSLFFSYYVYRFEENLEPASLFIIFLRHFVLKQACSLFNSWLPSLTTHSYTTLLAQWNISFNCPLKTLSILTFLGSSFFSYSDLISFALSYRN